MDSSCWGGHRLIRAAAPLGQCGRLSILRLQWHQLHSSPEGVSDMSLGDVWDLQLLQWVLQVACFCSTGKGLEHAIHDAQHQGRSWFRVLGNHLAWLPSAESSCTGRYCLGCRGHWLSGRGLSPSPQVLDALLFCCEATLASAEIQRGSSPGGKIVQGGSGLCLLLHQAAPSLLLMARLGTVTQHIPPAAKASPFCLQGQACPTGNSLRGWPWHQTPATFRAVIFFPSSFDFFAGFLPNPHFRVLALLVSSLDLRAMNTKNRRAAGTF